MSQRSLWSYQLYDYNHPQTVVVVHEKHMGKTGYYLRINVGDYRSCSFPAVVLRFSYFASFGLSYV